MHLQVRRESSLSNSLNDPHVPLTLQAICQAAEAGDTVAIDALHETGLAMGIGVANVVNIFNPALVVLGGPLSMAGPCLLPGVQESLQRHTLPEIRREVKLALSASGPDASVIGAVATVVEAIFSKPSRTGQGIQL